MANREALLQCSFGSIGIALVHFHLRYQQPRLGCLHCASISVADITKGLFHAHLVACLYSHFYGIKQSCRLGSLAVLPELITVPGCHRTKNHHQNSADQRAPGVPKMLELIKLLLFFEIEVCCHVL